MKKVYVLGGCRTPIGKMGGELRSLHTMSLLVLGDLIGLDVVLVIMEVMLKETGYVKYRLEAMLRRNGTRKKVRKKNRRRIL